MPKKQLECLANLPRFKPKRGEGAPIARLYAETIVRAYLSHPKASQRAVANAMNLPYDAVREVISEEVGTELYAQLLEKLTDDMHAGEFTGRPIRPDGRRACGARTRRGTPCMAPPTGGNGRCKLHGGKSTGAKSKEGIRRQREGIQRYWERRRAAKAEAEARAP